jgi:hypothetical protein
MINCAISGALYIKAVSAFPKRAYEFTRLDQPSAITTDMARK